jgi:pullulanase
MNRSRVSLHPLAILLMGVLLAAFVSFFYSFRQTSVLVSVSVGATPTPAPEEAAPKPGPGDLVLSATERGVPGEAPAAWIHYRDDKAKDVRIAGAWDAWTVRHPMRSPEPGVWSWKIGGRDIPFGRYEFKFIVDGVWEGGANRLIHVNEEGLAHRPPDVVSQALIEGPNHLRLILNRAPVDRSKVVVDVRPYLGEPVLEWRVKERDVQASGFLIDGPEIEFIFDPAAYGMAAPAARSVQLAGNFNGWNASDSRYRLRAGSDGQHRLRLPLAEIEARGGGLAMFKFVVNGDRWMEPPDGVSNVANEAGTPHMNLVIQLEGGVRPELWVKVPQAIELHEPPVLIIRGLHEQTLRLRPTPGRILDTLASKLPMGVTLDRAKQKTIYRLFAPRAVQVQLALFDGPYYQEGVEPNVKPIAPKERINMRRLPDGAWEHVREGLNIGQYYSYNVFGPLGDGEAFNATAQIADPYAKAVAHAEGNSIVMDMDAENPWFKGWDKESRFKLPEWQDMVIYETHVRDFTQDASSGVAPELRGTYAGVLASAGTGTGLDHLKRMGVNVIQFMPIHEFNNGITNRYDWGYATGFFFAPEASYALKPTEGSQVYEFKHLVNELQKQGFAVFLDVVYNHIGGVDVFSLIDRKYYFRLNPDLTNQNFSGCGNDAASERPMMRRLITESVLFWIEEYGVNGFRFDLAELIDMDTLRLIELDVRKKHPKVVLISEPWSFRGSHKSQLKGTGWAAWNDQFREPAKRFMIGQGDPAALRNAVKGSTDTWTGHPLQSVNYIESHDDKALVDELSDDPKHDGRNLTGRDLRIHKLGATLLFTSLGMPMITEGQTFLRSKHGIRNTYNKGDALNAIRWNDRERPIAREVMEYYRQVIALRQSKEGRAFRTTHIPAEDYVRFVDHADPNVLGYFMNANKQEAAPTFLVLMNAGQAAATVEVDVPAGAWAQVGDGERVDVAGLKATQAVQGGTRMTLRMPPHSTRIYRDGFAN